MSQSLNLHLVSDTTTESLASIASAIRANHAHIQTTEYPHPSVHNRQALDSVLSNIEAAHGIVLYTLQDQGLADILEKSCRRLQVTCIAAPRPSPKAASKLSPSMRYAVLGLLGVFLAFETITRSGAAYLAETNPEAAMHGLLAHPTALMRVAVDGFKAREKREASIAGVGLEGIDQTNVDRGDENQTRTPLQSEPEPATEQVESKLPSREEIQSWLQSVLREDPLNARAFSLLGQIEAAEKGEEKIAKKDEEQVTTLMRAAVKRSLQESNAVHWMMRTSFENRDYTAALGYADTLLRSRQKLARDAIIVLAKIAEDEPSQLNQLLARDPSWRRLFFIHLPKYITDARTPLNILLALKGSPNPPVAEDLESYLNLLVSKGFYDVAYYTWLQFLPPEQLTTIGLLYNGSFEVAPSPSPFDWTFSKTSSVTMKVANSPDKDGSHALFLDFGVGRVGEFRVSQLVLFPPGEYGFRGKYISELVSKRGLQWRFICAGSKTLLGTSQPVSRGLGGANWKDFSFSFSVPSNDCPAQFVELVFDARYESERFISGSIWYEDLEILKDARTAS